MGHKQCIEPIGIHCLQEKSTITVLKKKKKQTNTNANADTDVRCEKESPLNLIQRVSHAPRT